MKLVAGTFLLLILLSCSSAENDASIRNAIASEAQLQQMNQILYELGERYAWNIESEYITTPKNNELLAKRNKLFLLLKQVNEVDSITKTIIDAIDKLKYISLKRGGKNYELWKSTELYLNHFDLSDLKNASDTDIPSELFLNGDLPNEKGMEIFNQFKTYRNELVKILGRTETQSSLVIDINDYKNKVDLKKKVRTLISSKVPNPREDEEIITDLYMLLTLPNKVAGKQWIVSSLGNSDLIGVISTLTILQNKIFEARSLALEHICSRINSCGYGFDRMLSFAQGPSVIHEGETAEITVGIAAFDSYNQPEVTIESMDGEIRMPENGTGKVRIKPKQGLQTIRGTVSIKNKSGVKKTENWEWDIRVLPKK